MFAAMLLLAVVGPMDWVKEVGGTATADAQGRIVALDLSRTWVNDSDLQRVGTFTELRTLDLSHTRVTDLGFVHLKKLRNVTAVNLYYAELVGDGACAVMKLWPKLQTLNMRGTKVTDTGVAHLAGHAGLESIDVGFALFTDNGVELLATMPKLRHVAYGGNKMTDVGLSPLKLILTLRELDLGGLQRTDSGLWQVTITDRGLEVLGTMTELEVLNLRNAKITDAGIDRIFGLRKLKQLNVVNTLLTETGVARLKAALPNARVESGQIEMVRR
ncbi:MAG: hypothetical protein INH40_13785 [Acidobacteriaceae bacterium]|nr:hypothetical protein [Acidobacteriaceae bacterium]